MTRTSHEETLSQCATYRATEIGKLFLQLLDLEADRRLKELETADERHFQRLQGGVQALRELRKRIGA